MKPETQKKVTIVTTFIFFLLGGIEYAVILPTLLDYVTSFNSSPFYLGLTLAAFSLAGLLVSPFFGILHDRLQKTKGMLLFANCFEIGGNLLYFFAPTANILVASRFIAGIGAGVGASMLAQIARTTTDKERSSAFALFMAARQFGLIFGPALNLLFISLDTHIGKFDLNKLTAPGLFMALVWSLFQLMVVFLYYDLPFLSSLIQEVDSNGVIAHVEVEGAADNKPYDELSRNHNSTGTIQNGYGSIQNQREEMAGPSGGQSGIHSGVDNKPTVKLTAKQKVAALLQEEMVVLLAATFIFFFNQTALETCITPLTQRFLKLDSLGNSLLYCMAGFEIIIGFVLIKILSSRVQDRVILTIGLLIEIVSLTFLCIFLPLEISEENPSDDWRTWVSLIGIVVVQVSGLPFILVANVSLLSKLVPEEIQGFSQGVRRSTMGIGMIMGPMWATGVLTIPIAFSTVMVLLFTTVQLMVFLSWKKLAEPHREMEGDHDPRITSGVPQNENQPLLNSNDDPGL